MLLSQINQIVTRFRLSDTKPMFSKMYYQLINNNIDKFTT